MGYLPYQLVIPDFFQIRWIVSWGFGDTMRALRTGGYATTHAGGTWSYHCQKRTHQEGPKDIETSKLDSGEKSLSLQSWEFCCANFLNIFLHFFHLESPLEHECKDRKNAWEETKEEEKFDTHRLHSTCNMVGSCFPPAIFRHAMWWHLWLEGMIS